MMEKFYKFYLVTQPGFEQELQQEIQEILPFLVDKDGKTKALDCKFISEDLGGILMEMPLIFGLQLNLFSKLASRILLRLIDFRFEKFEDIQKYWGRSRIQQITGVQKFQFKVSAKSTFHWNEKRYFDFFKKMNWWTEDPMAPTVYIRVVEKRLEISLDTTGDHLYKRTEIQKEKTSSTASLRPTAAAFCLRKLIGSVTAAELSQLNLIDPMAGSGTFLSESFNLHSPLVNRNFSFLKWPECPKILRSSSLISNYEKFQPLFKSVQGMDKDPMAVESMRINLSDFPSDRFEILQADFFKSEKKQPSLLKSWIIVNPPYGERIKADFSESDFLHQLATKYSPERIGVLYPSSKRDHILSLEKKMSEEFLFKKTRYFSFKNGGIPVDFFVWERKSLTDKIN